MKKHLLALILVIGIYPVRANPVPTAIFREGFEGRANPTDVVHLKRGFSFAQKDDCERAAQEFKACTNLMQTSNAAVLTISTNFRASGDPQSSIDLLTKFLKATENKSVVAQKVEIGKALQERANSFCMLKKFADAATDFKQAALIDPQSSGYDYRMAGDCLRRLKKYDEAIKIFNKCVPLGTESLELAFQKGQCLEEMKRYTDAISEFDSIVKELLILRQKSPERFTALLRNTYVERASCHDALGQKRAADLDRRSLAAFAEGWENDLFGDTTIPAKRK